MDRLHTWDELYEFACTTLHYGPNDASSYARERYTEELRRFRISLRLDADA
jgi:coenzyme F420-reducing hydrogenase delta subunit